MVQEEDIVQEFDIDPTPALTFSVDVTYVMSPHVTDVRYGGWTDSTYLFVLPRGGAAGKFDINFSSLEELNGVTYDVTAQPLYAIKVFQKACLVSQLQMFGS